MYTSELELNVHCEAVFEFVSTIHFTQLQTEVNCNKIGLAWQTVGMPAQIQKILPLSQKNKAISNIKLA